MLFWRGPANFTTRPPRLTETTSRPPINILAAVAGLADPPDYTTTRTMEQGRESVMLHSQPELTPLEAEVLEEYEKLADNMKKVRLYSCLHTPPQTKHCLHNEDIC